MTGPALKRGEVVGAAILGFVIEWGVIATFLIANIHATPSPATVALVFLGPPALFALLLLPRGTRRKGASLLIGLLIGSITGAGVCAGVGVLGALT